MSLERALGRPARSRETFKLLLAKVKEKLKLEKLPSDGPTQRPERHTQDMLGESIDLARRHSAEIEAANIRMDEYIERNAAVFQSQIDYLTNILTPASSLSPTWQDAATSGMLSAHDGSTARPHILSTVACPCRREEPSPNPRDRLQVGYRQQSQMKKQNAPTPCTSIKLRTTNPKADPKRSKPPCGVGAAPLDHWRNMPMSRPRRNTSRN